MRKILIIFESEDFALALRDALLDDYDVILSNNAITGMQLLQIRPDALVLDLLLPGMDGLSFMKSIGSSRPPVVLMLTAFLGSEVLQAMSDLGVDYTIRKPCPISIVVKRLMECLSQKTPLPFGEGPIDCQED